jgi:hypothetical protein
LKKAAPPIQSDDARPFGVNAIRLNLKHWMVAGVLLTLILGITPVLWSRLERFQTGPDYRIPYELSKDYWLYGRRMSRIEKEDQRSVAVVGDSVVWGEYVARDGTLSHFLNRESGRPDRFVNAGVNGLFPLALEGLVRYYGGALRHRKVILHCNVLWMSSPKADLQTSKEEKFNHPKLVPQFFPRIPCYRADANDRLGIVVERSLPFFGWVNHLQTAYFNQKSFLDWTLATDDSDPPRYPNCYGNPLARIRWTVPGEPKVDPMRGPSSPRHKPWSTTGKGNTHFEWVDLDGSLQWGAFRRLVILLQNRDNEVLVVLGPFNEHFMAPENMPAYQTLCKGIVAWLEKHDIPHVAPKVLPSERYADASHPLTEGYAELARQLWEDRAFQGWLGGD